MVSSGIVIKNLRLYLSFALLMGVASCAVVYWQSFTIKQQKEVAIANISSIAKEELERSITAYNAMLKNISNRVVKKENSHSIASLLKQFYIKKPGSKIDFTDIYWYGADNTSVNRYGVVSTNKISMKPESMPDGYLFDSKIHGSNKLNLTMKVFDKDKIYMGSLFVDLDIASWLKSLKLHNPEYELILLNHKQVVLFSTKDGLQHTGASSAAPISLKFHDIIFNHSMQFGDPPYMLLYGYSTASFYKELVKSATPLLAILWSLGIALMIYQRFYAKALKSYIKEGFIADIDSLTLENIKSAEIIQLATVQSEQDKEEIKHYKDLVKASKLGKKERQKLELMLSNKMSDALTDIKEIARVLIQGQEGSLNVDIYQDKQLELMGVIHSKLAYLSACCVVFERAEIGDLRNIIDDTVRIYAEEILDSKLTIKINIPTKIQKLYTDELLLRQLLANLLRESISCSRPSGAIQIGVTLKEGNLTLIIKDDGFGISEELSSNLPGSKEIQLSPLNLDLQTMKEVVESLHGSLATQYVIGQGKTITLSLPITSINDNKLDRGSDVPFLHFH